MSQQYRHLLLMVAASLLVALSTSGSGCNYPGTMNRAQFEKYADAIEARQWPQVVQRQQQIQRRRN
jgi:hypothetical protein